MEERTINITGWAKNIEGHAVLVADNIGTFFIQGMDKWQDEWIDRKVKIIGDLKVNKKSKVKLIEHPVSQLF